MVLNLSSPYSGIAREGEGRDLASDRVDDGTRIVRASKGRERARSGSVIGTTVDVSGGTLERIRARWRVAELAKRADRIPIARWARSRGKYLLRPVFQRI